MSKDSDIHASHGTPEFTGFWDKFLESCRNPKYEGTVSIINLQGIKNKLEAFKNKRGAEHMEENFINWWNEEETKSGFTYNAVEIYTNYSPCYKCASKLRDWLTNEKRLGIKLSIYYKFMFIYTSDPDYKQKPEYPEGKKKFAIRHVYELWKLRNDQLKYRVMIKDIDIVMLKKLAKGVGFNLGDESEYNKQVNEDYNKNINWPHEPCTTPGEETTNADIVAMRGDENREKFKSFFENFMENKSVAAKETPLIIKLKKSTSDEKFMAVRGAANGQHAAEVFTHWSKTQTEQDFKWDTLTVYMQCPCYKCVLVLSEWIKEPEQSNKEIFIYYKFSLKHPPWYDTFIRETMLTEDMDAEDFDVGQWELWRLSNKDIKIKKLTDQMVQDLKEECGLEVPTE